MDPVNALFWNQVYGRGEFENGALAFSCGRRICMLCVSMAPSPRPSTSSLRPLHNNSGGLHACVRAAEDIEPFRVTRAKYSAPLPLHWVKKDYGHRLAIFVFFFLCSEQEQEQSNHNILTNKREAKIATQRKVKFQLMGTSLWKPSQILLQVLGRTSVSNKVR